MTEILEINTNKRQSTLDSGYHSADDLSSSPTTTLDSRRSSFSSFNITLKKQQFNQKLTYSTLKSANERIEYLEEQLKTRKENNGSIIKNMSIQIDTFLKNRKEKEGNLEPTLQLSYSNTDDNSSQFVVGPNSIIIEKLNELKQFVTEYNIIIAKPKQEDLIENKKLEIFFSTQIIENWITSATKHKCAKPDILQKNVESIKRQRLVLKKKLDKVSRSEALYKKKLISLQQLYNKQKLENNEIKQDREEIEQLLDEVRKEMEIMMEELNQVKLERQRYLERSTRYEEDLKAIQSNKEEDSNILALESLLRESENQMTQLELDYEEQNKELKKKLEVSERSIAELSLVLEVQKKQKLNIEMEQALRRTVAEKDGELAKVKFELEKSKRQTEQMKLQREKQMQFELNTRLEDLEEKIENKYKKESDTYQVQISRDIRNLTGKMVDLELELENLEYQHEQDIKKILDNQRQLKTLQDSYKENEANYKENLIQFEQKTQKLEGEVLLLYKKNLEMAQHLGELDTL